MNTAHLTPENWAEYIQTFQPSTESEYKEYLTDLHNYAKRGNIESGISELRCRQIKKDWPEVLNTHEYKQIRRLDLSYQTERRFH